MKRTLLLFAALGVVGSAHAVVIDDFTTATFTSSFGGNAYFTVNPTVPNAVGPLRYFSTFFNANPVPAQVFVDMVGDGKAYIETGPGVEAEVTLAWAGGLTSGTGSVVIPFSSINLTNINLASVDGVVFRAFMDHSQDVTITRLNAVPEPASMVALGAGLLALLRRSRRA